MASFVEGLAGSLGSGLEKQQQGMLELKMLSKKIELEQQARMSEMEKQHELNQVPGQQLSDIMNAVKNGSPLEGMFPEQLGQAALSATGMQLRANAMMNRPQQVMSKPDHNNLVMHGFQEPMTGQWIGQPQVSLDPHAQQEIEKVDASVSNANNMIGGILQRAKQVLPNAPIGVPINKLDAYWQSHGLPTNPDLKAFQDSLGSLSAQYIKDTTGMAPRSLELMALDTAAFPNTSDDVQSAAQKAQILQQVMQNKAATAHTIYDPTDYLQSPLHPKSQGKQLGQQAADANAMHTTSKGTKYIVSQ